MCVYLSSVAQSREMGFIDNTAEHNKWSRIIIAPVDDLCRLSRTRVGRRIGAGRSGGRHLFATLLQPLYIAEANAHDLPVDR